MNGQNWPTSVAADHVTIIVLKVTDTSRDTSLPRISLVWVVACVRVHWSRDDRRITRHVLDVDVSGKRLHRLSHHWHLRYVNCGGWRRGRQRRIRVILNRTEIEKLGQSTLTQLHKRIRTIYSFNTGKIYTWGQATSQFSSHLQCTHYKADLPKEQSFFGMKC